MDIINLYTDNVLIQVFGYLSPGLIKSCCLVCKRWNEIIGTSQKLMKRFQLKNPREAMEFQRKYQSAIIIAGLSLDVICRHNLQTLELKLFKTKLSTLINVLNKLISLKVFNVDYAEFIDDLSESRDSLQTVSTNIEQLKCGVEIVHIFDCCSVKKLKLYCDDDTMDEDEKEMVIDFLKKQTNLEDLDLFAEAYDEFFALPDFIDLKFSLKKFRYGNGSEYFPYYEAFIKFLSHHARSLTSLEVVFFTEPTFELQKIHKYALEHIVNLKHIKMDYFDYDNEIPFNELPDASQITKNLETLELTRLSSDMNINKSFFDLLPNLKHLHFEGTKEYDDDMELLYCINERCLKLESLQLFAYIDDIPIVIYFPKLKEIKVEQCFFKEVFCAFINQHSHTLERITIYGFDAITRSIAEAIIGCPNLNYLKLNPDKLTIGLIMMIHEISSRNKPFTFILPGENYKFTFPDDKAIFYTLFYDEEIDLKIQ